LAGWIQSCRSDKEEAFPGKGHLKPNEAEVARLTRELTIAREERDILKKALTDAGSAGDPWSTALPGAYGAGTAGKIIGDNLNATVGSRATQTSVDTVDDFLDTEIAAIKAKTDSLTFTVAGQVDANIQYVNDTAVTGNGSAGTPWGP
jgi:hypothetical protein